ncbi:MAG: DUF4837 family protein [Bacteroidales bacterium]|nr:DUF4837 family protein [Bacteroidales bacterium]MDD3989591.1 DUF4837 family protein [Bacteroidales bacterium]MDD4638856.1 DUF4837 family protein [Bacteroidales bacterium]
MKNLYSLLLIVSGMLIISCSSGPQLMPNISGKAGEVVIVISKGDWESDPGAAIRSVLAVEHPYLPQREPLFTLINIPEKAFTSIFQTHRNLLIVRNIPDLEEPRLVIQENVWAAPQIVITVSTSNPQDAAKIIQEKSDLVSNALLQAERNRNIQNAKKYEERTLRETVLGMFGGSPYFPKGYNLRKQTDNFIWISYETTYTNQGVLIYRYPYRDSTDLHLTNLVKKRNEILARNVPGSLENTYMTTNMYLEPGMRWVKYNKRDFIEMRGLWELQNDFMGGPFVDHIFLDMEQKNIIVLEAFVYAPSYDKRNYLRQVESILYSFEFFQ